MFCRGKNIFFWYQQIFLWSYLRYQLFVMFNFEYAQIIKIRTSVSLQKTTTSESTLEPCNNLISCRRNKIFFFSWSNNKRCKVDLGRIPKPNSSTYYFLISINWSLYWLSFKSSSQLLPCGIFCSKPVMLNLVEEVPRSVLSYS